MIPCQSRSPPRRVLNRRAARRHPRRRNLATEAKERAHAARLPARRAALYGDASDRHGRRAAPGRPQGGDRLGTLYARERARGVVDDPPAARGAVVAVSAPDRLWRRGAQSGARGGAPGDQPARRRDTGVFQSAGKLLDLPAEETIAGLRDRAILSVGLQVGLRRAEIAALIVGDLHQNRGYDSLRVTRKGGRRDALAINPQTAARLRAYLEAAGHAGDN